MEAWARDPNADGYPELAETVLGAQRGRHAFENCVERLATAIKLGIYPDQTTLPPERELAITMGVSRATLREAIAALRAAGLVRTTRGRTGGTVVHHRPDLPGRGAGVDPMRSASHPETWAGWLDALAFRRVVEPGAAQLAASRALSPASRIMLRSAERAVAQAEDPGEHRQADSRLHLAVAALSGSARLVDAVTGVQADLHEMLLSIPVLGTNIDHSHAQHAGLVDAVLGGDGIRARRLMESHCDDTAALLRGLLGPGRDARPSNESDTPDPAHLPDRDRSLNPAHTPDPQRGSGPDDERASR